VAPAAHLQTQGVSRYLPHQFESVPVNDSAARSMMIFETHLSIAGDPTDARIRQDRNIKSSANR